MRVGWQTLGAMLLLSAVASALAQAPEPPGPAQAAALPADAAKVPSADFLGPKLYTLQMVGTVQDALRDLEKLTGWHFAVVGKGPDRGRNDDPVALDFTDATLDVILLGLCEQAGLVYDVPMGGNFIQLRRGDLTQDPRPSAMVDDYVIRVTDVRISTQRSFAMRWGEAFTEEPTTFENLSIGLQVCPRSLAAAYQLGAMLPGTKATTEKGTLLESPDRGGAYYGSGRYQRGGSEQVVPITQQVQLAAPTDGSLSLTQLEGSLHIFPDAKPMSVDLTADSKGKTLDLGPEKLTVEDWSQQGPNLIVSVRRVAPPRPPATVALQGQDVQGQRAFALSVASFPAQAQVVAIGADGVEYPAQSTSMSGGGDGTWKLQYVFGNVAEVATVRYTAIIRGEAEKQLPFVVHNIPLP
jgi:hypothetical protein